MSNRGGSRIHGPECEYHQIGFSFDSTHDLYGPKNCVDNNSQTEGCDSKMNAI